MALFGNKQAENEKLHAELSRISALPLVQLAAEVMARGFGSDGPAAGGPAAGSAIAGAFNPAHGSFGIDNDALVEMYEVVVEALQVLEHACLVRLIVDGEGGVYHMYWTATRSGRSALERGAVEQILGGAAPA